MIVSRKEYFVDFFSIIFFLSTIASCSSRSSIKGGGLDNYHKRKIDLADSSLTEYINFAKKAIREEIAWQLGIRPIANGLNGTEIRIYNYSAFGNDDKVIILSDSSSHWSAKLAKFSTTFNYKGDSVGIVILETINKKPHSAWNKLLDTLVNLDIFNLPTCDSLAGYDIPTDGGLVEIEFRREGNYRIYDYNSPTTNYRLIEVKKVLLMLDIIEKEFDFSDFGFHIKSYTQ